jgi:amino acid permease
MRGSIFALCSGAIGTGVLSLPYVLKINGWIVGIALIMLGAFGKISLSQLLYSICDELYFAG